MRCGKSRRDGVDEPALRGVSFGLSNDPDEGKRFPLGTLRHSGNIHRNVQRSSRKSLQGRTRTRRRQLALLDRPDPLPQQVVPSGMQPHASVQTSPLLQQSCEFLPAMGQHSLSIGQVPFQQHWRSGPTQNGSSDQQQWVPS
jgi:hypothetical protein